jgi:hypothetical protein
MPSPFPGMDPYLEQNDWVSVHVHLGVEIARFLAPLLRPKYYARAEKIYLLSDEHFEERDIERRRPDVSVRSTGRASARTGSTAGVLEPPLRISIPFPESVPQVTVEIKDAEERSLITAIEILSFTNKHGSGREEYLAKRNRLLASGSHLIELDFLRAGMRMPTSTPLPDDPYFVLLSRVDQRPVADVWPISVRSTLPVIPVPLSFGDPDVELDLQAVMTTLYETYGYDLEINYSAPLKRPLSVEDTAWAAGRIRDWRNLSA